MTRVGVVEDHPVLARALRQLLEDASFTVSFVSGTVAEARTALAQCDVDIVLLDIALPDGTGYELLGEVEDSTARRPQFIVLSSSDDAAAVGSAERAGARGFISKVATPGHIVAAVRDVASGKVAFDLRVDRPRGEPRESDEMLSPREVACLALVAEGLSNREVGEVLGISGETVKTHLDSVRAKLGAADRAQAVALGVRRGYI